MLLWKYNRREVRQLEAPLINLSKRVDNGSVWFTNYSSGIVFFLKNTPPPTLFIALLGRMKRMTGALSLNSPEWRFGYRNQLNQIHLESSMSPHSWLWMADNVSLIQRASCNEKTIEQIICLSKSLKEDVFEGDVLRLLQLHTHISALRSQLHSPSFYPHCWCRVPMFPASASSEYEPQLVILISE